MGKVDFTQYVDMAVISSRGDKGLEQLRDLIDHPRPGLAVIGDDDVTRPDISWSYTGSSMFKKWPTQSERFMHAGADVLARTGKPAPPLWQASPGGP